MEFPQEPAYNRLSCTRKLPVFRQQKRAYVGIGNPALDGTGKI
ncbi:MAG: hypothetical protein RBS82_10085 [Syntrophales bacterium]|nr:hypothetical protein [Syntrophales bacterium]